MTQFLATVHAAGITSGSGAGDAAGRWVCNAVHGGNPMADVVKTVQDENPGLQRGQRRQFAAIAANVYCPTRWPASDSPSVA